MTPESNQVQLAVMVDSVCHRYGVLPSKMLSDGDTFDVWCYDVAQSYWNYIHEKHSKNKGDVTDLWNQSSPEVQELTPEQLQAYQRFRNEG